MDRFKLISSCLFVQKKLLKLKNGFFGIPKRYLRSEIKEFLLFDFLSLIERDDEDLILQAKSIASRCFLKGTFEDMRANGSTNMNVHSFKSGFFEELRWIFLGEKTQRIKYLEDNIGDLLNKLKTMDLTKPIAMLTVQILQDNISQIRRIKDED